MIWGYHYSWKRPYWKTPVPKWLEIAVMFHRLFSLMARIKPILQQRWWRMSLGEFYEVDFSRVSGEWRWGGLTVGYNPPLVCLCWCFVCQSTMVNHHFEPPFKREYVLGSLFPSIEESHIQTPKAMFYIWFLGVWPPSQDATQVGIPDPKGVILVVTVTGRTTPPT